jgi:hypothetical protein
MNDLASTLVKQTSMKKAGELSEKTITGGFAGEESGDSRPRLACLVACATDPL